MRRVSKQAILGTVALGALLGGCATTVEMGPGFYHYDVTPAHSRAPVVYQQPTVVALREIAAGNVTVEMLREPEPPVESPVPEMDVQSTFRAPQFGLGD